MIKTFLIISLIFLSPAQAQTLDGPPAIYIMSSEGSECPHVEPIQKGQPAPCDGFYFSDEAEKQAASAREDAETYQKINTELQKKSENQAKENEILERRLKNYIEQSDVLSKNIAQRDNNESLYRMLYFGLGAVVTGFIAANVSK